MSTFGRVTYRQRGLTLIELIIFIVVISVGLVGILTVMNVTSRSSADPVIRKQALAVAEAMMEEILSKDFQNDPTGDNGTTPALGCTPSTATLCRQNVVGDRQNYNDVDDYNNWDQNGVFQVDGTAAPIGGNYRVRVDVTTPFTLSDTAGTNGVDGKQVTVTVTSGPETIILNSFRANF